MAEIRVCLRHRSRPQGETPQAAASRLSASTAHADDGRRRRFGSVRNGVGEDRVKVPGIKDGVEPGLKIGNIRPRKSPIDVLRDRARTPLKKLDKRCRQPLCQPLRLTFRDQGFCRRNVVP